MPDDSKKVSPGTRLVRAGRRRLLGLSRRTELRLLASLASARGQGVWIVGGALRDLLLARPVLDVDVAVSGDAGALARAMEAAGAGRCVPLSDRSPRVFRIAGDRDVDIAELWGGSIDSDLSRRDFTVNAIASALPDGRLLDPFGGSEDLARRRLRVLSEGNLREDPLRVLRAARLMATHRLTPDRAATAAARRAAPGLPGIAAERVRVELVKLLEADRVSEALRWLRSVGALGAALGLRKPVARGARFQRALRRLDRRSILQAAPAARLRLRLCVIADGLGLSPPPLARWLADLRFSREEARAVAALSELAARAEGARTARQRWEWIHDSGARRGEILRLLSVRGFPVLARRLAALRPRRPVRVSGSDVLRWLHIPPGPAVGALLREIEIEALRGALRSRGEARKWLIAHWGIVPTMTSDGRATGGPESRPARALPAPAARRSHFGR